MKKALFVLSFAFVFALAGVAHADSQVAATVCVFPDHAIWNGENSAIVGCITAPAWDAAITAQVVTVNNLIHVNVGQRVLTTWGFEDQCPSWFPFSGCVINKALFVKFL